MAAHSLDSNPHDALFKATFGVPEHAAGELRSVLPAAVVERLDLETLRSESDTLKSPGEVDRYADVILSVQLEGGGEVLVYVLLEHQSTVDRWMVLRMLRYLVRLWEQWLQRHPGARQLPAVLPVVVAHDPGGWRVPKGLGEALALDAASLEALGPHLPLFGMVVDDLSGVSDAELRARAMTSMGKLALGLLKHARRFDRFFDELERWADAMREVLGARRGLGAQSAVLRYMHLVNDRVPPEKVAEQLGRLLGEGTKEAYVTYGELLIQQGVEKGIEKGIEQGIEKGERKLLRRQLERRFGTLAPHVIQRFETATEAELERWAERVLTATTLDEVLQG
ncbi:MAG: Rpn family recombination-promoting nuclease/putative transposase [Myxococcota bacterium]